MTDIKDENIFSVKGLKCSFGLNEVLKDVTFDFKRGEILGLIGPSGGGKSVLLKVLAGVIRHNGGTFTNSVDSLTDISLMFQEGALFDSLSVLDNVIFPLVDGRVPASTLPISERTEVVQKAAEILSRVGLAPHSQKLPGQLSGGMRRRLSLARAVVSRPQVALLDDPTCGLDPVASSIIMDLIRELHSSLNNSMLLVSHDLRRLLPVCHRIIALFGGKIVFEGTVQDLIDRTKNDSSLNSLIEFISCRYDLNQDVSDRGIDFQ